MAEIKVYVNMGGAKVETTTPEVKIVKTEATPKEE